MPNINNKNRDLPATSDEQAIFGGATDGLPIPSEYIPGIDLGNYINPTDTQNPGDPKKTGIRGFFTQNIWQKIMVNAKIVVDQLKGNTEAAIAEKKISSELIYPEPGTLYDTLDPSSDDYFGKTWFFSRARIKEIMETWSKQAGRFVFTDLLTWVPGSPSTGNEQIIYTPGDENLFTHSWAINVTTENRVIKFWIKYYLFLGPVEVDLVLKRSSTPGFTADVTEIGRQRLGTNTGNICSNVFYVDDGEKSIDTYYYRLYYVAFGALNNIYRYATQVYWESEYAIQDLPPSVDAIPDIV